MKIPNVVRIKRRPKIDYQVAYIDAFDDSQKMGECDPDKKIIWLKRKMSKKNLMITLIHEIIHACDFENEIYIPDKIIGKLDTALYQVLKLNGWF